MPVLAFGKSKSLGLRKELTDEEERESDHDHPDENLSESGRPSEEDLSATSSALEPLLIPLLVVVTVLFYFMYHKSRLRTLLCMPVYSWVFRVDRVF